MLYSTVDGKLKVEVTLQKETVWLTLDQMAQLFDRNKSTISRHIKNIFAESELNADSTVAFFATVQHEGKRDVERQVAYYNLDMIISVGYKYLIKGFVLNDDLLKNGGGNYFDELLARIRDIRSSEKVFYRKVLEIYA
ncbi:MAG: virulence RhuM family protein [Paludibacteraceae bacterium]|nr:virulence RhuM family protein [Paludibacteraceae bacterium]